jgi:hypothetical protein
LRTTSTSEGESAGAQQGLGQIANRAAQNATQHALAHEQARRGNLSAVGTLAGVGAYGLNTYLNPPQKPPQPSVAGLGLLLDGA